MRFSLTSLLLPLTLSISALSQTIAIGAPADLSSVHAGSNLNVEVDRPNSLSGSTEVAIVIAINSCHNTTCVPPDAILGSILYNGPYKPALQNAAPFKPPHQNFTVKIPESLQKGRAQLAVYHVALIGAGPAPFTETRNVTLNIL
ncbi:hypothetical protein D9613_006158 [Agrocybe pediades]|uniref:Uncharacterized protein n=1 Tax=Agrocybe pediades TaxID=84607 RepID=A0A8H4VPM6_9AGAR|nr:hypothetical protein D9613_006158 [Agrocybe pediades]